MPRPYDLDPLAVRRQFDRRARAPTDGDFVAREVESRMLERLPLLRIAPRTILDVGCGRGDGARALMQRFPQAMVLGVDASPAMARVARGAVSESGSGSGSGSVERLLARLSQGWRIPFAKPLVGPPVRPSEGPPRWAAADAAALPLADASVDLLWSNLAWHWFADPSRVAEQWRRVLRPGGVAMFSALGIDTLRELRAIGARLPIFPDMHDIGDLMTRVGLADPVLDAEHLTVTWTDPLRLIEDLRALGGVATSARARGLSTPRMRSGWLRRIDSLRDATGRIMLSFELIQAQAWSPAPRRLADGLAPIRVVRRSAR